MNILLVRPKPHKETIGLRSVMICEPLELMVLSSVLKKNGHNVSIVDMILEKRNLEDIILEFKPHWVGLTGYISHVGVIKDYAKRIKGINPIIKIAVGGVHATVCPKDFCCEYIDVVCKSEKEFYELTKCKDLESVLPDRELPEKYLDKYYYLFSDRCALIKTSLGCPYSCKFCFCKEIAPYKARDIDDVIKELLTIKQKEVYIVDDDFLFNRARLLEFADKLEKNNISKNFLVYGRADFIANNPDVIKRLAKIGLNGVIVGLEACSQDALDNYNKGTTVDNNVEAIRILRENFIECYGTVVLGIDWEKKDFDTLFKFLKDNKVVFVNLQPLTPMPATEYFQEYKKDLIIPYEEHEKWDMAHLVVAPKKMSVRLYYWNIVKLYYKLTVTPHNIKYMFSRYGVVTTTKLSIGAMKITMQYFEKIIRG